MLREQLNEDRIRNINRLHREMKIYFPEYMDAIGKPEGSSALALLKEAPLPEDILVKGPEGLRKIWKDAKLKGRGYNKVEQIVKYAEASIGLKHGSDGARKAVRLFVEQISFLSEKMKEVEEELHRKCLEIPHAENILEINGIGENTLSGIIAEMGDVSRFDDVKEIQKLSGLGLVACSSGKHKGETRISHRGRKRLRHLLFDASLMLVANNPEFKALHLHYTTRKENPLKKKQSIIAISCKLIRVFYTLATQKVDYNPGRLTSAIKLPDTDDRSVIL